MPRPHPRVTMPVPARSTALLRRTVALFLAGVSGGVGMTFLMLTGNATAASSATSVLSIPVIYNAVACANASDCWIVTKAGGAAVIEATVNGGQSWTVQSAPSGIASLTGVACPSTNNCWAIGTAGSNGGSTTTTSGGGGGMAPAQPVLIATTNGGASWSSQSFPSSVTQLSAINCPGPSTCFAGGGTSGIPSAGAVMVTTNAGTSWTAQTLPSGVGSVQSISCGSSASCVVVGQSSSGGGSGGSPPTPVLAYTSNGGSSWSTASIPSGIDALLGGVSCGSSTTCAAAGSSGSGQSAQAAAIYSTNGGASWTLSASVPQPPSGDTGSIDSVACPSAGVCVASGNNLQYHSTNGGATWSSATSNPFGDAPLNSTSCGTVSFCMAAGGDQTGPAVISTSDGGSTWTFAMGNLDSGVGTIACPSTAVCYAMASSGGGLSSTNGGSTWSIMPMPSGISGIDAVSCPTVTQCVAGGQAGAAGDLGEAIVTTNGGSSWTTASIPSGTYSVQAMSCGSATVCVAVGGYFIPPQIAFPTGDGVAIYSSDGGATYQMGSVPQGYGALLGVSCPSASLCIAAGQKIAGGSISGGILTSTDGGKTWTALSAPQGVPGLNSISCSSNSDCSIVAGSTILATTNGGTSWTSQSPPSGVSGLEVVSCATASSCDAVGAVSSGPGSPPSGSDMIQTADGGTTWTSVTVPSTFNQGLIGLSCPSSSECLATGWGGIAGFGAGSGGGTTTTSTTTPGGTGALTAKYLMTFSACNLATDPGNCSTPATEMSYLAESNDGTNWTLASSLGSGEFAPFQASVPAVVTRGNEVYVYGMNVASNNQMEVVVYNATTGAQIKQANITLSGFTNIQYVDPDPVVLPSGGIVLFFTDSKPGCNSGTVSNTTNCISSATEVSGSDGTQFTVDSGDRVVGPAPSGQQGPGFLSITDPEVFYDGTQWVILVAGHTGSGGTLAYTSSTPQGTYALAGTIDQIQTPPSGFFDTTSGSYLLYLSSFGNTSSVTIGRATASSLTANLSSSSFTTVVSDSSIGLPTTDVLHASDAAINTAQVTPPTTTTTSSSTSTSTSSTSTTSTTLPASGAGYWMLGSDGTVHDFGSAGNFGNATFAGGIAQGMVATPDGKGYWVANDRGEIDNLGDAAPMALSGATLPVALSAIARTPDGGGLWGVTAQGQVLTAGDAANFGNAPSQLSANIVNMAVTPDGKGYWLLGADGGIFTFGDAGYFGSTGGIHLNKPAVAMAVTSDGQGYWFVASDGGMFAFGDATYYGSVYQLNPSAPATGSNSIAPINAPANGIVVSSDGRGYWMVASDGGVFTFGDAGFVGSLGGQSISAPIVAFAPV